VAFEVTEGLLAERGVELDGQSQVARDDLRGFGGAGQVARHDQGRAGRAGHPAGEFPGGESGLIPAGRGEAGRRRGLTLDPARGVPAALPVPHQPQRARGLRTGRAGFVPLRRT
jgi:hypothetical protein